MMEYHVAKFLIRDNVYMIFISGVYLWSNTKVKATTQFSACLRLHIF